MMLAAMLAMVMLLAAPAMAQTADDSIVERCVATLNQANEGDVIAANESNQDAAQYQYAPGGDADAASDQDQYDVEFGFDLQDDDADDFNVDLQYQDADIDATGGAGGTQDADQDADQDATATGATFDAEQAQYCSQVALSAE